MLEFGFDLSRIGHRFRNLLPEQLAIALPEPMNRDLECALRCAHLLSERGIRRVGLIEKKRLQAVEMIKPSMLDEF